MRGIHRLLEPLTALEQSTALRLPSPRPLRPRGVCLVSFADCFLNMEGVRSGKKIFFITFKFHKQMMELSMLFSKLQNWMNPKFSCLTSSPSSPPEQEQQKQCFLVRIHDSTVVENPLLEQLGT
ncbi:hypothetical protein WA026_019807 [Henosepilachna vigintioctopunctata]|uniref:Uncharacterized protein n=1 Tax=Henosepilachna vigintioctopunctata TaxID=420089 RepID=A0AAW1VAF0_9CUCU